MVQSKTKCSLLKFIEMFDRQFRELIFRSFNWPVQVQTISQILPSVAWHTTENNSLGLGQLTTEKCDMLTLDTLISICICPYCFLDIFLKVLTRRICLTINWFPHCWLYLFSHGLYVWFKGDLWEHVNCKSLLGVRGLRWMGISVSEIRLRLVLLYLMLLNHLWQVDWSQRYDVCHKQLPRLSAQGIQQFVDSITFSELAVDTIPVENRVEIVNRALRFARQQDAALKKKGISESQEERYKLFVEYRVRFIWCCYGIVAW